MLTTNSLSGGTKCIQLSLFLLISLFCEKSLLMWRAQLHRMKPRGAQRENSGAGRSHWMGTALLPETQPVGKGLPGSAPLSLRPGQGHGCASAGFCPHCSRAAASGSPRQLSHLRVTRAWMDLRCQWAKAPSLGTSRLSSSLPTEALEQQALSNELHKVVPTKTVLLLHFFDDVDWHSPALCDEPRRLSMLSFLEHKGSLNVLTW